MNKIAKIIVCLFLTATAPTVLAANVLDYLDCGDMTDSQVDLLTIVFGDSDRLMLEAAWLGNQTAYAKTYSELAQVPLSGKAAEAAANVFRRGLNCGHVAAYMAQIRFSKK